MQFERDPLDGRPHQDCAPTFNLHESGREKENEREERLAGADRSWAAAAPGGERRLRAGLLLEPATAEYVTACLYSFSSLLITGKYFAFLLPAEIDIAIAIDSAISSWEAPALIARL